MEAVISRFVEQEVSVENIAIRPDVPDGDVISCLNRNTYGRTIRRRFMPGRDTDKIPSGTKGRFRGFGGERRGGR